MGSMQTFTIRSLRMSWRNTQQFYLRRKRFLETGVSFFRNNYNDSGAVLRCGLSQILRVVPDCLREKKKFGMLLRSRKLEYELMKEKEKYSKESMEIIRRSNEELREFKHDLKNYLLPLQEAMETMPQSEMVKVWEKINQKIEDVQTLIQTGNSYVDSMINTKITLARSEKVDVKCTILSKMEGIDDLEFCTVFGNLMDNAIEAERKVTEKKEIIIFVEEKVGYLRLEIQNKIEKSVLNENSSLNTTKKDTSSHGIGHKSVKRTMQKVGGALKYYETGDLFCAEAVFPIK